eukprot:Gb_41677 [translate_table: standard]
MISVIDTSDHIPALEVESPVLTANVESENRISENSNDTSTTSVSGQNNGVDAGDMESTVRFEDGHNFNQTSSHPDDLGQTSGSIEGDKVGHSGIESGGYLELSDISRRGTPLEITHLNDLGERSQLRCDLKEGSGIYQKFGENYFVNNSLSEKGDPVLQESQNCAIEASTISSELPAARLDGKPDFECANEATTLSSHPSDVNLDEIHLSGYELEGMTSNEEQVGGKVDLLQIIPTSSLTCGVLASCVKGKQFSSGEKLPEGQKESDSVEPNEEPSDRGLTRANTMPSMSSNYDEPPSAVVDNGFMRSKTERRKGNKTHDHDNILGMADKMSDRKKMKIMKKIAMVKGDGTVEFDVHGSARYASNLFGPSVEPLPKEDCGEEEEEEEEGEKRSVPPLQIVMLIVGTRGDVQPFVAIGKHLQEYGHRVRLATHSNFEEFVLTAGLEFYPLGGDPKVLAGYMVKNKGFLPSVPSEITIQRKQLKAIINSLLPACTEPYGDAGIKFRADAILANPPAYGHVHVAEALKVPLHIFFTMPWTPTSKFPHPLSRVKQSAGYRLSYQVVDSLIWLGIRGLINDFRKKKLKLRPVTYLSGSQGSITDFPTGYIWSPHLVPKPEDWGPKVDVVGFCFLNLAADYMPPESLLKWLEAGKKPIYVGFGSLPVQDPEGMTSIIVQALKETGQRGIINKGWGGLGDLAEPPDFIYLLDNCPHDWLFPHCAAVVHHGGAGTTAAGLKAACPTTIVPFFGDQPFWGERVHARGLGPPPIPVDQFSLPRLVAAIHSMLDPKVKENALQIAKAMENEDGVSGAVKAFHKHLPKKMPQPLPPPSESNLFDSFFSGIGKLFACG